jgi:hypothetical protein
MPIPPMANSPPPPTSVTARSRTVILALPPQHGAPCPLCGRRECADEVEDYLHAALRGSPSRSMSRSAGEHHG